MIRRETIVKTKDDNIKREIMLELGTMFRREITVEIKEMIVEIHRSGGKSLEAISEKGICRSHNHHLFHFLFWAEGLS